MRLRRLVAILIFIEVILVVDYFSAKPLPHDLAYARAVHLAYTNSTPEHLEDEQQESVRMQRRVAYRAWVERGVLAIHSLALAYALWQLRRATPGPPAALP